MSRTQYLRFPGGVEVVFDFLPQRRHDLKAIFPLAPGRGRSNAKSTHSNCIVGDASFDEVLS